MRKAGLIFGLVLAFGCVPEGKIYDPEATASPSKDKRQPPANEPRNASPLGKTSPLHSLKLIIKILPASKAVHDALTSHERRLAHVRH